MKIPPENLRLRLYGTFRDPDVWIETGLGSFVYLRDVHKVKSHFKILDLACGAGRVALPFSCFLDPSKGGAYYGLDVDKEMMDWCSANMNYENLHFVWADVHNSMYFRQGTGADSNYKFPYEDSFFDFGYAWSLWTHLLEPGGRNYLNEVSRTLKPSGKFMLTCFLFNQEREEDIKDKLGAWSFKFYNSDICRYDLEASPESTVGYTEEGFIKMVADAGLKVVSIDKGQWSKTPHGSHDIVLLEK